MNSKKMNPIDIPEPRVVFYVNSQPIEYEDYMSSLWLCNMRNQHRGTQVSATPKRKIEAVSIYQPAKRTKYLSDSIDNGNILVRDNTADEISLELKNISSSCKDSEDTKNCLTKSSILKPSNNIRYKYQKSLKGEEISKNLVYHSNMARIFPDVENRTPEQIEYRKKNTLSARISRAKTKMIEEQLEQEISQTKLENLRSKRTMAAYNAYANNLLRQLSKHEIDWSFKWENRH